jgi:hypothetical protein
VARAFRSALLLATLVAGLGGTAGCGGDEGESTPTEASTAADTSTPSSANAALVQTVNDDASAFSQALATVTATCPVPKVTQQTMKECKTSLVALIGVDGDVVHDLEASELPPDLQAKAGALETALDALTGAQKTIIRKFIDKGDVPGFESAGGPGSPIDDAIVAAQSAFAKFRAAVLLSDGS